MSRGESKKACQVDSCFISSIKTFAQGLEGKGNESPETQEFPQTHTNKASLVFLYYMFKLWKAFTHASQELFKENLSVT